LRGRKGREMWMDEMIQGGIISVVRMDIKNWRRIVKNGQ